MSAHYEIVLLIDTRPPKDPLAPKPDEAYEDALRAASHGVIELVTGTMREGFGWLAPEMAEGSFVCCDIWRVDFYEGKLEWLFYAVGDGWQANWLEALSTRWPRWKIAVQYDTTNRMWAGSCIWDEQAWQIEDYDITEERPLPQWEQVKALQKRDDMGRLDWGPPPAMEVK